MATDDDEYSRQQKRRDFQGSIRVLIRRESSSQSSSPNHPKHSIGSICKVPDAIRNLNPGAYTPRITSIGPLHKENDGLRGLDKIKVTYMYRLFCKTAESTNQDIEQTAESTNQDIEQITDTCVNAVLGLIGQARACYAPSFTYYNDIQLANMMVIDGCFILELLHWSHEHGIVEGGPGSNLVPNQVFRGFHRACVYAVNALGTNRYMAPEGGHSLTQYDLLLLENQIPFCILEILFSLTVKQIWPGIFLTDLILRFFKDMNILNNSELKLEYGIVEYCHILGLLQSCYRPGGSNRDRVPTSRYSRVPTSRYSATEIAGAGVTFKPNLQWDRLLAVQFLQSLVPGFGKLFIRKASFEIPVLRIEDSTPSFLRNLIAF